MRPENIHIQAGPFASIFYPSFEGPYLILELPLALACLLRFLFRGPPLLGIEIGSLDLISHALGEVVTNTRPHRFGEPRFEHLRQAP